MCCTSHRFKLSVEHVRNEYKFKIGKVKKLVKELSYQISSAKLQKLTLPASENE